MECFLAFLFLIGMAWFCLLVLLGKFPFGREETALQRVARRYRAHILPRGWFQPEGLQFDYTDTSVTILVGRHRRYGGYTEARFHWPNRRLHMVIAPVSRPLRRSAVRRLARLDSPSDTFFWRYRVYVNEAAIGKRMLSDAVKWYIEQLRQILAQQDVELSWHEGQIVVRKFAQVREAPQWEQFIALALRIYDQSMLMIAEGIEFVEDNEAKLLDDVSCQICGDHITTDMVFCRRCKTPHHRECWEYTGHCSVFACRETQFFTPRIATPGP